MRLASAAPQPRWVLRRCVALSFFGPFWGEGFRRFGFRGGAVESVQTELAAECSAGEWRRTVLFSIPLLRLLCHFCREILELRRDADSFVAFCAMLSHEEALVHARQHLYSRCPPIDWIWVLRPGQRVTGGWFFYYGLEPVRLIQTSAFAQFGGAPGFLVDDSAGVRTVSWHELSHLLPPKPDRVVLLPEIVSVRDLAKAADVNIYTMALLIRELKIGDESSRSVGFDDAVKILKYCGITAKKTA